MVLRHGFWLAAGGIVVGILGSLAMSGLLRAMFPFPGVSSVDAVSYLVVVPVLLVLTLLAAYFPARRAARVDPLIALRQE
jgi:putative ABC transport system permease protein